MGDGAVAAPSRFRTICVFCGSNTGRRKVFGDAALELGNELVRRGINLVYGGGSIGLMGMIARTVLHGGCHVLGVIPKALMPIEISGESVGEVKVVADMHQRKAEMARQSEAFIALPGGYGTMEELLEMITWSQLGIHDKPVGLLNVDGYYDLLLALFDKGATEGFINPDCRQIFVSAPTANELLTKMEVIIRNCTIQHVQAETLSFDHSIMPVCAAIHSVAPGGGICNELGDLGAWLRERRRSTGGRLVAACIQK